MGKPGIRWKAICLSLTLAVLMPACSSAQKPPLAACLDKRGDADHPGKWVDIESAALRVNADGTSTAVVDLSSAVPADTWDGEDGALGVWLQRGWRLSDDSAPNAVYHIDLVGRYVLSDGKAQPIEPMVGTEAQRDVSEEDWIQILDGGRLSVRGDKLVLDIDANSEAPSSFFWSVGVFFQTSAQMSDPYDWTAEDWCPVDSTDADAAEFPGDADNARAILESVSSALPTTSQPVPPSTSPMSDSASSSPASSDPIPSTQPQSSTTACEGVSACSFDNGIDIAALRSELAGALTSDGLPTQPGDVDCDTGQPPNRVQIGGNFGCVVTPEANGALTYFSVTVTGIGTFTWQYEDV